MALVGCFAGDLVGDLDALVVYLAGTGFDIDDHVHHHIQHPLAGPATGVVPVVPDRELRRVADEIAEVPSFRGSVEPIGDRLPSAGSPSAGLAGQAESNR